MAGIGIDTSDTVATSCADGSDGEVVGRAGKGAGVVVEVVGGLASGA